MKSTRIIQLSKKLLLTVRIQDSTTELVSELSLMDNSHIEVELKNDDTKKAFWINTYNAFYQLLSKEGYIKPDIFTKKLIFDFL